MTQEEIKQFIADKTAEGMSLTAIQDALSAQGVKIRFMELRLLAAEIESVLAKKEADKAAAEAPAPEEKKAEEAPAPAPAESAAPAPDGAAKVRGATTVSVSPIQRPGFAMSGSVSFGSGVTADWYVDQTGRLGLDNASGQPDEQDIQEFQIELRKALGM
ncbi:MAG: hypothetical protein IJW07_01310 [Lentisphaeria bacterium]|nr:hypothetical protein [Lentisphaeria bacterium]